MTYIYIIISLIIGFFIGRSTKKSFGPQTKEALEEMRESSQEALDERTRDRKNRVMALIKDEKERHEELMACHLSDERKGINRQDVEDLLGVSKKTALKYINELEEEGKIKQVGITGKDVYYMLSR